MRPGGEGFAEFSLPQEMPQGDGRAAGLFPAVSKDKTGYVNQEGKLLIPHRFEDGKDFSQGVAAVLIDGKWGYVDEGGEIVLTPVYQDAGDFAEGMAWVQIKGKYGYINRDGEIVVEPRYRRAGTFSEGFAVVANDRGKTSLIDKNGKAALNPDVYGMDLSGFSEGLLFGYTTDNRLPVFMGKDGKMAIRIDTESLGKYDVEAAGFSEGLAAVEIKRKWGYVDRSGVMVIEPEYWRVTPFRQGVALVSATEMRDGVEYSTEFIIDRNGTRLARLPTTSGELSEGLIPFGVWDAAQRRTLYGYMDVRGETAIAPQFDEALPFANGLARVQIHGANAYVDKRGRLVWVGEVRGDERVTSYSGRSMIDMYRQSLGEENGPSVYCYIEKMSRKELVEGSRITLEWLLEDPTRTETTDGSRQAIIGMVAVAPFLYAYSYSFLKDELPTDPSPFRSMLFDKSLDIDFRRELAGCLGDDDFYVSSWEQIAEDTEVLNRLARDPAEDEVLRDEAAHASFSLILQLYEKCRRDTFKDEAFTGDGKAEGPDIVGMLGETPCPFSAAEKVHWELLVNSMEKATAGSLVLYEEAQSERIRKSIRYLLKDVPDYHLIRDRGSLERIREMLAEGDAG